MGTLKSFAALLLSVAALLTSVLALNAAQKKAEMQKAAAQTVTKAVVAAQEETALASALDSDTCEAKLLGTQVLNTEVGTLDATVSTAGPLGAIEAKLKPEKEESAEKKPDGTAQESAQENPANRSADDYNYPDFCGRLYIPAAGIDVALYNNTSQDTCNRTDSAAIFPHRPEDGGSNIVADNELESLTSVAVGSTAYAFTRYCNTPEQNDKLRQKLACKMSGTIHDAMQNGDLNPASPSNTSLRRLTETQVRSAKFVPSTIYGTFKVMNLKATNQSKIPSFKSTRKFVGAFADKNRVLSEEEKGLVPQIGDDYILPKEVVAVCHLIAETRGSKRPMTNVMLRGETSVGKTAGARAIAAGLGLPYTFITCNAGTEMYNFIGDMMPVDSSATSESINAELFKNLPSATDISIDPVNAYMAITGVSKPDATEAECMTELFRKQLSLCADACKNGFKYVESPLVRAIRNGWVCELQEPSLITRPAVMPGLNGLLDETGCVVLPTGEMLHRHPDCIIISTLNIDLEGCRPLNQSFIDRHHIIMDMVTPSEAVIESRIRGMTGCDDTVPLKQMIAFVKEIAEICARFGATDGNVNSMRSLANWVQAGSITGDYATAATWTVISDATSDLATREELVRKLANYQF